MSRSSGADEFVVGRNETMIELTERQREALIMLGGSSSFEMRGDLMRTLNLILITELTRRDLVRSDFLTFASS